MLKPGPESTRINRHILTMRAIHAALIASLLIYCFVIYMITGRNTPSTENLDINPLFHLFSSASVLVFLISRYFKKQLLHLTSNRLLIKHQSPQPKSTPRIFQKCILIWALDESIGLFGLVLSFLSGNPTYCYAFVAVALFILLVDRPRSTWIEGSEQFSTGQWIDPASP